MGRQSLKRQPARRVSLAELGTFKTRRGGGLSGLNLENSSPPELGKSYQRQFRKTSLMIMEGKMGRCRASFILNILLLEKSSFQELPVWGESDVLFTFQRAIEKIK